MSDKSAEEISVLLQKAELERDAAQAELYSMKRAVDRTLVSIDPVPPLNQPWQSALKRIERVNDQLRAELSELKTKHENLAKYARETWDKYSATQAEIERLRKENEALLAVAKAAIKYAGPISQCCLVGEATGEACGLHSAINTARNAGIKI